MHQGLLKMVDQECEPIRVSHHSDWEASEGTSAMVNLAYISETTSPGTPGVSEGAHATCEPETEIQGLKAIHS